MEQLDAKSETAKRHAFLSLRAQRGNLAVRLLLCFFAVGSLLPDYPVTSYCSEAAYYCCL
jgi:hypothetical protein